MIYVKKASGELVPFDKTKIVNTVMRAGADKKLAEMVASKVEAAAKEGISTQDILKLTLNILDKYKPYVAARYSLKSAIMSLGPAGFAFEDLLADILEEYGYRVKERQIFAGACIAHEVDVVAEKEKVLACIEAKYHNAPGIYTGAKDALYIYARFLDLKEGAKQGKCPAFTETWLATNTKFSMDAIEYGTCKGMKLLGWNFPSPREGLQAMIENKRLYPITVLRTLDRDSLNKLSEIGLMLCKDLIEKSPSEISVSSGVSERKVRALAQEAKVVLG